MSIIKNCSKYISVLKRLKLNKGIIVIKIKTMSII